MQQQLQIMLELQDSMNTRVNQNWRAQHFAWYRAIWIECGELMDHFGWKWWKHQHADMAQVKLELIDIWHFGLSLLLQQNVALHRIVGALEDAWKVKQSQDFRTLLEEFTEYTLANKNFSVSLFVNLLQSIDMSFDELYTGYIGKNVLNFFRQDHGYQEGSYQKLWHGREDNEHLVEVLESLDSARSDFSTLLYDALEARYRADAVVS
ncbi:MAG: dUTP diphosphatase [Cellvibrionaceae bacterium]|nr:dUTP diphosphatase [Cellvibrionaceae bacterium]